MIYDYNITRGITDDEKNTIREMVLYEMLQTINKDSIQERELISNMCDNAYHYKVDTMEKDRLLKLNCNNLTNLNNLIVSGANVMLRQVQMKCWIPETKKAIWAMDVRCIRYHLEMLLFAFNERNKKNNLYLICPK